MWIGLSIALLLLRRKMCKPLHFIHNTHSMCMRRVYTNRIQRQSQKFHMPILILSQHNTLQRIAQHTHTHTRKYHHIEHIDIVRDISRINIFILSLKMQNILISVWKFLSFTRRTERNDRIAKASILPWFRALCILSHSFIHLLCISLVHRLQMQSILHCSRHSHFRKLTLNMNMSTLNYEFPSI